MHDNAVMKPSYFVQSRKPNKKDSEYIPSFKYSQPFGSFHSTFHLSEIQAEEGLLHHSTDWETEAKAGHLESRGRRIAINLKPARGT